MLCNIRLGKGGESNMFHKRLIKEFRENQKNIWGMVPTQWVMLIANVVLMLQTAAFIAGMVRKTKVSGCL